MWKFQLSSLVVGLVLGTSPVHAEHARGGVSEGAKRPVLEESSVTCGDHWFKVKLFWSPGSTKGKAIFSGDSRPERDSVNVKVTENSGSLLATFEDAAGGEFSLEGVGTSSLSGKIKETEKASASVLSPCYQTK